MLEISPQENIFRSLTMLVLSPNTLLCAQTGKSHPLLMQGTKHPPHCTQQINVAVIVLLTLKSNY